MPTPPFQPRRQPELLALLHRVLERVRADIPDAIGLTISVHDILLGEQPTVVTTWGSGSEVVTAQLDGLGGPVVDAVTHQVPVISLDLWHDDRWPQLTPDAMLERAPRPAWERVCGLAAVPGFWQDDATVVITCLLDRPATARSVATLIGYEPLVCSAFVTTAADDAIGIEDMLSVLQSRGAIEQAKGAIMSQLRCDADQAWLTLRRTSQEFNVKVRELAVALLEHISNAPAEQPAFGTPIIPDQQTRRAARLMWQGMSRHATDPRRPITRR